MEKLKDKAIAFGSVSMTEIYKQPEEIQVPSQVDNFSFLRSLAEIFIDLLHKTRSHWIWTCLFIFILLIFKFENMKMYF